MIENTKELKTKECVLIPKEEYDTLKKELNILKNKEDIVIYWGYFYYNDDFDLKVEGRITLSDNLYYKIRRITESIYSKVEEEMLKDKAKFEEDVRTDLIEKFQKLPWYKRLWFNPKYIQK